MGGIDDYGQLRHGARAGRVRCDRRSWRAAASAPCWSSQADREDGGGPSRTPRALRVRAGAVRELAGFLAQRVLRQDQGRHPGHCEPSEQRTSDVHVVHKDGSELDASVVATLAARSRSTRCASTTHRATPTAGDHVGDTATVDLVSTSAAASAALADHQDLGGRLPDLERSGESERHPLSIRPARWMNHSRSRQRGTSRYGQLPPEQRCGGHVVLQGHGVQCSLQDGGLRHLPGRPDRATDRQGDPHGRQMDHQNPGASGTNRGAQASH